MIVAKEIASIDVVKWWSRIKEKIEEAMLTSRGKYNSGSIFHLLLKEQMQLWIAYDKDKIYAVGLSELIKYPLGIKICRVICIVGEQREEWQHLMKDVEAAAKKNGCVDMELWARPGWSRIMKSQGYEMTHIQLNKSLR